MIPAPGRKVFLFLNQVQLIARASALLLDGVKAGNGTRRREGYKG
jgi:hypothetical protein